MLSSQTSPSSHLPLLVPGVGELPGVRTRLRWSWLRQNRAVRRWRRTSHGRSLGAHRIRSSQQRRQFSEIRGPWTPPQIQNETGEAGTSSQGTQDILPGMDLGIDIDESQEYALALGEPVYRHARRCMEFQSGVAKRARVQEQSAEPIVELMRRLRDLRESGASAETFSDNLYVDSSFRGLGTTLDVTSTVERELINISLETRSPYEVVGDIHYDPRLCHPVPHWACIDRVAKVQGYKSEVWSLLMDANISFCEHYETGITH